MDEGTDAAPGTLLRRLVSLYLDIFGDVGRRKWEVGCWLRAYISFYGFVKTYGVAQSNGVFSFANIHMPFF